MPYLYEKNRYHTFEDGGSGILLYNVWIVRWWPKTKILWVCCWNWPQSNRNFQWYINKFLENIHYNGKIRFEGQTKILEFVHGPKIVFDTPLEEAYVDLSTYNPALGWGTLD